VTEERACREALTELGFEFTVPERVDGEPPCNARNPVKLAAVSSPSGRIELHGRPILACTFARQFGTWLSDIAGPVVLSLSEARLTAMVTGPGYECRKRTGDGSGKMSEHAFGNAVDIAGITLSSGRRLEIADAGFAQSPANRMLAALRISACGYFTTVLGPGSNAAHASHFHFDSGRHGKSSNYRICE
jgi:hypothetical protein